VLLKDSLSRLVELVEATELPRQLRDVDGAALLHNPWFLVPALALLGSLLYRQAFRDIIILLLIAGVWYASGTDYMQTLTVDGQLQLGKVLPVIIGGAGVLAVIIYLLFGRSD